MPVIGAAMVVHMKGIEDSMIMTLGRWKAMLNYQSYVRIPQEHLAQLSCHMATPANLQVFHPLPED